jgi:hypothetical protein
MKQDPVFGRLTYESGWTRPYAIPLFGRINHVPIVIAGDEDGEIEPSQQEAFKAFDTSKVELAQAAERALHSHYNNIREELRERTGGEPHNVPDFVRVRAVFFPETFGEEERVVGLLFDAAWDPSLGVAVKFVNEQIAEVGPQDIVL